MKRSPDKIIAALFLVSGLVMLISAIWQIIV
ncbi:protein MgtR [Enterobacter sp. ECC-175]|nr:protein MgtR [Enterobacter sp. RIT 418]RAU37872.1 protein MgtR [Enterobacter sp. RIT 418]